MKLLRLLLFMALVSFSMTAWGQIQVGTGTDQGQEFPFDPYYGYTYSQSIYLQTDINASGNITSIQWYFSGTSLSNNQDITIWMAHSSKSSFANTTDWEPLANLTQVYSGSPGSPSGAGWITVTLDVPFAYNNTDNLIIAVDENTSGYNGLSDDFYCSNMGTGRSIFYRNDNTNPNPASPPTGSLDTYVPNVILGGITVSTPPNCTTLSSPANAATNINVTTDLTWTAATGVPTGYKIDLGTTTGGTDILNDYDAGLVTTYNLPNDLTYNTTYYATVKPYNGNGSAVGCTETTFTTKDGCVTPFTPSNGSSTASINQTISWSSYDAGVVKYIVSIGTTAGGTDILNAHDNGTATTYAASGLSYSTQYYVSIKAENANGLTTAACNTYNFTTMADPTLTPPFVESFASYLPANWTETSGVLAAPSTLSGTTSNWGDDGFANSGGTGAAGINIYGTSRKDWLISPSVNLGAGGTDYQLEFDLALTAFASTGAAQTTGSDDIFAVVISTDNGVTWTSVNTLRQWDNAGSPYVYNSIATAGEHIVLDLSAYSGVVKFGFYGFSNTSNADNDLFVDNVEVSEILSADVEVTTVTVPASGCGLTANESVMVTITNNGMNPIAAGDASVVITGAANSPAAVVNVGSIASLGTEVITITGVDLSTVQAYTLTATVTLTGDGNAGNNTGTGSVTNLTTISSFPYNEGFEGGAGDWTTSGTNSSWAVGTPSGPVITAAATGSNAFVTNLSGDYNANELSYLTSACFDLTSSPGYELSFKLARDFENCCDEAWVEYTTDGTNWIKLGTASSGGTNWYNDATNNWWDNDVTAWTLTSHDISALAGNSSVRFRFVISSDGGVQDDGVGIDDIAITEISCPDPSDLTATGLTTSTASLDWTENGTATAWDIEWGAEGFSATGTPTITGTTTKPYDLTGLTANTGHDFYVRSNCGGSTSAWVGPYTFTTPCVAVATFYEDFESSTSSTLPDCMQKSGSTQTVVVNTTPSNAYAGDNSLRLYGTNATFVLPITSNIDAGTHRLRMQVRATSSSNVRVGYIIDPDDASTFTELQTLSITTSYQEYVVVPGVTPPSGSYLALQHTGFSSMYFDNVYWEELPVTPPNCSVVTSPADAATNQNVTTNLSWAANVDATGYKLSIGTTTGGTDILNASDLGNVLTYNPPADLAFNTTYYVTLTAYNANGDATGCTETTFTTRDGCAIPTSPTNGSTSVSTSPTISWSSVTGATGYMISIGTTAGGTDILNAHDNGTATTYAASGLSYSAQYFVSVKAYNANGTTSAACNTYEFTTGANPNFGGGPDGTDSNQPNSGGYYFANSLAGAGASTTQPTYSWIDPVAAGHTEITSFTGGDDDGTFTIPDIGFDFTFYGSTYRTSNAFVSTNGLLAFGASYAGGTASFTIPSTDGPEAFIAGCYADLDDGTNGKIYYGGDANHFVVTWLEVIDYGDQAETISFQIILYPNGLIKIQYNDLLSTADELGNPSSSSTLYGDALIGIENAAGDKGISYRDNGVGGPMFGSPMALAFNTNENALPVELTTFSATTQGNTNLLQWETASEQNNSHFEVQRSTNGAEFETIGTIEGNGTTVEASKYNFVDETPAMVSYYRLRQVDFDGNFEYSNVVIVKRDRVTNNEVTLYPVPVNDRLTVQYTASTNEEMTITVVDVTGRIVVTNAVTATQGDNQFFIDFTELPSGSYFVRLQSDLTNTINTVIKN